MSRRKQLKPMHIRNEGADINNSPMNSFNGKETVYEEQEPSDNNIENLTKTKEIGVSSNGIISLLDPLFNSAETPKNSILADFSCLIPKDDDELLYKKNDRKENFLDQEAILRQFVADQIRKTGRHVGRVSRGRGRGKGRGRGRGRGRGTDVYGRMNRNTNNLHLNVEGSNIDDKIMRCRICSKPFKRQWSLQVHELIHHQAHDSIPENLALTLAPSDRRRLDAENMKGKMNSLKKNKDEINMANWCKKDKIVENQNSMNSKLNNCDNTIQNKTYASLSPDLNSDAEENNNETTSQSSETGSLSADICITEHIAALQHTPMFGGITVPSITNFRELRRQVSLARRTCKYCGKVCFKPSDLQRHLMKHTGERPFSCSQCGRKFKAKRSLHYHQRASHGAIIELSPALEDKFAQTKKYQKMMLQGSNGSNLSDVGNDHSSLDSNDVAEQMITNDKDCNQSSTKLESHLSDENDELSSGLSDSAEEEKDLEIRSQKNDKVQNTLEKLQIQSPVLEENVNKTDVEDDVECDNDYENHVPSSEKLNADVSAIIPAVPTEPEDNLTDEKTSFSPITSEKDNEKHPFFNRYKINFRSEEIIASRLEGINSITGEKVFLYKCHLCGKIYSVMSKLQNHLTVHMKRNKKQYSCANCDEVFKFRSQWLLHSRTHKMDLHSSAASQEMIVNGSAFDSASTKFQEDETETHLLDDKIIDSLPLTSVQNNNAVTDSICNATPPIISAINAVSLYQSNPALLSPDNDLLYPYDFKSKFKQNYNCRYCGKYFDRPFSLQRHERMHTGIKPCYCKDCGRGFSEPRNLRHHIIRFHSDGSLHHLLRRNRCKNDTPLKTHSHSRMLPFGNYSVLKKNSDNFMNDSTSNMLKADDVDDDNNTPPTLEEMVPLNSQSDSVSLYDYKSPFVDVNQNVDNFPTSSPKTTQEDGNNEEKVTIVIPTEVDNSQNQNSPYYDSDYWTRQDTNKTNSSSNSDKKEILTDPKRSLIGNRRKHRPHKLIVSQSFGMGKVDTSSNSEEHVDDKPGENVEQSFKVNEPAKSFQSSSSLLEKSSITKTSKPSREEHWQTRMTVASLLAKQRGIELQPRKSRPRNRKVSLINNSSKSSAEKIAVENVNTHGDTLPNGSMVFACCFCNKSFSAASDLSVHMNFHKTDLKPTDSTLNSKINFTSVYESFSSSDIKSDFSNGSQRR